jgi:hypothetical protein
MECFNLLGLKTKLVSYSDVEISKFSSVTSALPLQLRCVCLKTPFSHMRRPNCHCNNSHTLAWTFLNALLFYTKIPQNLTFVIYGFQICNHVSPQFLFSFESHKLNNLVCIQIRNYLLKIFTHIYIYIYMYIGPTYTHGEIHTLST